MSAIEALFIFDEHNTLLLEHIYTSNPPPPSTLLSLYLAQSTPRPSLIYLPSLSPPSICYSIIQDNILLLSPQSAQAGSGNTSEPLLVLEFLHRVADALQEFLGTPLLATKITGAYDIVAQILNEIADAGVIAHSEPNALRDVVETGPGVLKNLLGSIGASGASPALGVAGSAGVGGGGSGMVGIGSDGSRSGGLRPQLSPANSSQGVSAIPWRRSNVRHTSNELYVDIVESLSVTLAPSGRPLAAFAHGSVIFNCKVSGVPDLVLSLSTGGMGGGMGSKAEQLRRVMQECVFHPCVRLSKWEKEGVLSFVPPDGRFVLAGYGVDLLGPEVSLGTTSKSNEIGLPVMLDITTGLGSTGADFEVRVISQTSSQAGGGRSSSSAAAASLQSHLSSAPSSRSRSGLGAISAMPSGSGTSTAPSLEDLSVHIPLPAARIRNVSELRPSKGEAHWNPAEEKVEWKIPAKEFGSGSAVLRCTVQGLVEDGEESLATSSAMNGFTSTTYDYDDEIEGGDGSYQSSSQGARAQQQSSSVTNGNTAEAIQRRNKDLMPTSATLSFSLKGSLPSGMKVESLLVDTKKSRGLGVEVKPYKGVKYLTVSRGGVEVRS